MSVEDFITWGTPRARWILLATVLGSGIAFLDATVVNVALPTIGTELDAVNVRCAFRRVVDLTRGLSAAEWTPRELRHSFVSLLSSTGMSIEDISHLVGHASSRVTEVVYRKELRPVLTRGASAMDALFPRGQSGA